MILFVNLWIEICQRLYNRLQYWDKRSERRGRRRKQRTELDVHDLLMPHAPKRSRQVKQTEVTGHRLVKQRRSFNLDPSIVYKIKIYTELCPVRLREVNNFFPNPFSKICNSRTTNEFKKRSIFHNFYFSLKKQKQISLISLFTNNIQNT